MGIRLTGSGTCSAFDNWGTVALDGKLIGLWRADRGVPQGGSLSQALFIATTIDLREALGQAGIGILIGGKLVGLLGFVDDLVIIADSLGELRLALKRAEAWSKTVGMRFNIGPTKSAAMVWGAPSAGVRLLLDGRPLPVVEAYKYLGTWCMANGRNTAHLESLDTKAVKKTGELLGWARPNGASLDIVASLWTTYVENSAMWGCAVLNLSGSDSKHLDLIQRKVGRCRQDAAGLFQAQPRPSRLHGAWVASLVK